MIVELPTYRYDHNASGGTRGHPHELIEDGVLVPDLRLQDIVNAPRCKHGKIDRHKTAPTGYEWIDENGVAENIQCEGATELRALLVALTKEEDDE